MKKLIHQISLYYHTLRYLTFKQIYYQITHRLRKLFFGQLPTIGLTPIEGFELELALSIPANQSYFGDATFVLLNKQKKFINVIDWDFAGFGKLWAYNLNYFDFLNQKGIKIEDSLQLLDDYCSATEMRKEGSEPYPISLRGINWIKFFTYQKVKNPRYDSFLFAYYQHLHNNIEYHLLGNHLLENGFSLLFGAYYFRNEDFFASAIHILKTELKEQILEDGGHFELSPMYHKIILFRLLDSINLVNSNAWKYDAEFQGFLNLKAKKMLGWLEAITFANGDVPMVNDSAFGIAPSSADLVAYGNRLTLKSTHAILSDSGYRMIRKHGFELFIDVGKIGPDYIPGHAHSDTFNFLLYQNGNPLIVDTGITTYDVGQTRQLERSTKSHNTVMLDDMDQSQVWASFRVGQRARIKNLRESKSEVSASHDGYRAVGAIHERCWGTNESGITIIDRILYKGKLMAKCTASLHFHPDVDVKYGEGVILAGSTIIAPAGHTKIEIKQYDFAEGFNRSRKGTLALIQFSDYLMVSIKETGVLT